MEKINWLNQILNELPIKHEPYMKLRYGIRKSKTAYKLIQKVTSNQIIRKLKQQQYQELKIKKEWLLQRQQYFMQNKGNFLSIGEKMLREIINEIFPLEYTILNDRGTLPMLELDIHLPKQKLAFEFHGLQHYEYVPCFHDSEIDFRKQIGRDNAKRHYCKSYKIKLIEIPYSYSNSKEQMKSYLLHILRG